MLQTILTILFISLSIPLMVYAFWKLWFLRNPKRKIPHGEEIMVSPADGKIIDNPMRIKMISSCNVDVDGYKPGALSTLLQWIPIALLTVIVNPLPEKYHWNT